MFLTNLKPCKGLAMAAAGLLSLALTSCDSSFVYEDLRACVPEYRLRLSYDHNLAKTEAVNQVEAAEVYAFDKEGNLATVATADRQTLIDNDWTLPLDLQRGQTYDLVIWGGLTEESPFVLDGSRAVTSKEDLTCRLTTDVDGDGKTISNKKFPGLFHGAPEVTYTVEDGVEELTAKLIKNTNVLRVILTKEGNLPLSAEDYAVEIDDANGVMAHDNAVSGETVLYRPESWTDASEPMPDGEGGTTEEIAIAIGGDVHLVRLMDYSNARLKVSMAHSNIVLYDEPLIDLLLASKEHEAPGMDDQEYLDRQDTYTVFFQMPSEEEWNHVAIFVNNWRVIKNDIEWK